MRIHIFHTNDVHSQLENYMRLGARLRAMRDAVIDEGDRAFTFDIGDVIDRVRPETEATLGRINSDMMAALGYDAWVFGNNEGLTIPVSHWSDLARLSETVVLGTNLRQPGGEPFEGFEDVRIFQVDAIRLGIFGLTPDYEKPYELLAVQVSDPVAAARRAVEQLRQAGCQAVVCMSHLGLRADHALAEAVPGIDVILGGHTHQFMQTPDVVNGTKVFQPGKHGLAFGHTTLAFGDSGVLESVACEAIPIDVHGGLDAAMYAVARNVSKEVQVRMSRRVADLAKALPVWLDRESPFGNVLVDALFDRYPCDLGLMMAGALNASLLPGTVSFGEIHSACPTPTRPVLMTLSGADIRGIIEQAVDPDVHQRTGFGFGFRGGVIGWMALANARVTLQGPNDRLAVYQIEVNGLPLDDRRTYRLVTCEYLWLSPAFNGFREGREIEVQEPLVRDVLAEYMKSLPQDKVGQDTQRYQIQPTKES